jgi:enolase-phosphatase E1
VLRAGVDSARWKDRHVIVFDGRGVLLDVEGTTSSISFVYDVLFEFAKRHVGEFLAGHADDPLVRSLAAGIAAEAGTEATGSPERLALAAIELMNRDVKSTPLKALQGLIWRGGFESGELVAHVFPDVPPALEQWAASGLDVRIYSSGSIEAQRLYFGHTGAGNLLPHLRGHYDTTTGPKREASSYAKIAADMGIEPRQILFVSDVGPELDAARAAIRPGNREPGGLFDHEPISSFTDIVV